MSAPVSANGEVAEAVLYNAECPICRFEIDRHRAVAERDGLPLAFEDLNGPARDGWGVGEAAAARRLHVRTRSGAVLTGYEANLAMWRAMPGWRGFARVAGAPGLRLLGAALYERVFGPLVLALHRRRKGRV